MNERTKLSKVILVVMAVFAIGMAQGFMGCDCEEEEIEKLVAEYLQDSDSDTLSDQDELVFFGTNPASPDSDGDGYMDNQEVGHDGDTLNYTPGQDTDPWNPDTDGDSLQDGFEVACGSDPLDPDSPVIDSDSDRDGVSDWMEACFASDPNSPDTDGDLYPDPFEFAHGSDPADPDSIPDVTKVVINEIFTGTCLFFELYNVGSERVNLSEWRFRVDLGGAGGIVHEETFGENMGDVVIGPREFFVFDTGSGETTANHIYTHDCVSWCEDIGGPFGSFSLIDDTGAGHDFLRWGGDAWPSWTPDPPPGTEWNETNPIFVPCPAGDTIRRDRFGTDTDSADDWTVGFGTPGEVNYPDTDSDCLSNWAEAALYGTNPGLWDTDMDVFLDGFEIGEGNDPLSPASYPSDIIPESEPNNAWGTCTPVGDFDDVIAGSLSSSSYPTDGLTPIFVEDFSDGDYTDTFMNYAGGWKTVMAMDGHDTALCARSYSNDVHLFTSQWFGDAIIEFDYWMEEGTCDGGFFVRAQNSASGYLISVDATDCESWPVEWEAYRRQGGWTGLPVYYRQPQRIDYRQWRHYKVVTEGNRITVFEDDRLLGYFEDSQWATGGFGLRAIDGSANGRECVDNIVIYPLSNGAVPVDPHDDGSFFEDFAGGDPADSFMGLRTGITEIKQIGNHGTAICARGQGGNLVHSYTKRSFGDGVLEFDYYQVPGNPWGGVFLRAQTNRHGYLIEFPAGTGNPWKAWRMYDGGWTQLGTGDFLGTTIQHGEWTPIKVVMDGSRLTLYEDGVYRGWFEDTRYYDQGGVGIRGVHGETCIDNLSFRPFPEGYADDFSDFDVSDTFTDISGNINVKSVDGHSSALCGWGRANDIHVYTPRYFGDAVMEFDYYLEDGGGGWNDGGVFFRVHDDGNGYLISLDAGAWQAYYRWGGGWTNIGVGDYSALDLAHYEWRHYEIHMTGGRISLYEDGEYRGYFQNYHFQRGGVGLRSHGPNDSAEACIDNLQVTPLISDTNYYCIDAQAGQVLAFDVDAQRWSSPLDSYLTLYDTNGTTILARNGDACDFQGWCGNDSFLPYEFAVDGTYYLSVQGAGWGRETCHPYDLRIHDLGVGGDSDGDGLSDGDELFIFGTHPFRPDSDDDGLSDYDEINHDGDNTAYTPGADTDPWNPDTDGDGLQDGEEEGYGADPLNSDTDGDGLSDGDEVTLWGTNPANPDTDGDDWSDSDEVNILSTDPLNPSSPPFVCDLYVKSYVGSAGPGEAIYEYLVDPGDMANSKVCYLPDGSGGYHVFTGPSAYPSVGIGGTTIVDCDDCNAQLDLTTAVQFYGVSYDPIWVDSNGYINLDASAVDGDWNESTAEFEDDNVRLAVFWTDLRPETGGTVYWQEIPDRLVVTYDGVDEYGGVVVQNYGQAEFIYATGEVMVTYGAIDMEGADYIVGISPDAGATGVPVDFRDPGPDSDGDGLHDNDEALAGTNPGLGDTDGDGLSDWEEVVDYGSDPLDPDEPDLVTDSDTDGLPDWLEVNEYGTDPLDPDSDDDGLTDYEEIDYDGDDTAYTPGADTDPNNPDTDGDNLEDGDEVNTFGTDPLDADSDDDGLSDYDEIDYDGNDAAYTPGSDTDPNDPDTDGDGVTDGAEVLCAGTDPLDALDFPPSECDVANFVGSVNSITAAYELHADPGDMANSKVCYIPDGSGGYDIYSGAYAYPNTAIGGTAIVDCDDCNAQLDLTTAVQFYGASYNPIWVDSNGYINLDASLEDGDYSESTAEFLDVNVRLGVFWTDLRPLDGGTVYWQELSDRLVVTYDGVDEFGGVVVQNYGQAEFMYCTGEVIVTYGAIDMDGNDYIVGVSPGEGNGTAMNFR